MTKRTRGDHPSTSRHHTHHRPCALKQAAHARSRSRPRGCFSSALAGPPAEMVAKGCRIVEFLEAIGKPGESSRDCCWSPAKTHLIYAFCQQKYGFYEKGPGKRVTLPIGKQYNQWWEDVVSREEERTSVAEGSAASSAKAGGTAADSKHQQSLYGPGACADVVGSSPQVVATGQREILLVDATDEELLSELAKRLLRR